MSQSKIIIVDYGVGNLYSVKNALEKAGGDGLITDDPRLISSASRIILPGVGAFESGMKKLVQNGLDQSILMAAQKQIPIMGICLGMQLLLDQSSEFGLTNGLGLIKGDVMPIPYKEGVKIPHIGWSSLSKGLKCPDWSKTILGGIKDESHVYFVHSFMVQPMDADVIIALTDYGGIQIPAVIGFQNIVGCQFHPEKSGQIGLKILENFLVM
jgi:glutamine amidotransferase